MGTPAGRPTYGQWLDQVAEQGRRDDFGQVASAWLAAKANGRPKLSAAASVNRWLSEHPPPGVDNLQATLHKLRTAYSDPDGLPPDQADVAAWMAARTVPASEGASPVPGEAAYADYQAWVAAGRPQADQQPDQPADDDPTMAEWLATAQGQEWLTGPDGQAWLVTADGQEWLRETTPGYPQQPAWPADQQEYVQQHPAPPPEPPPGYQQADQAPVSFESFEQAVMWRLSSIEDLLARFWQAMAPLMDLAQESAQADAALAASALTGPQAEAQRIAAEHGWTTGPAFAGQAEALRAAAAPATRPDFYGGHQVAPPDFAQMAQDSTGEEDDG